MNKALIIIDIQNDYFEGGKFPQYNANNVLENIKSLVQRVQKQDMPVIIVQHVANTPDAPFFIPDTDGVKIHEELLKVAGNSDIVIKAYADSFYKTNLEEVLCKNNVDEILVCGMMTQNCVTHTAISKDAEKYKVKVITDCCTSVSEPIHFIALHALSTRVELITQDQI